MTRLSLFAFTLALLLGAAGTHAAAERTPGGSAAAVIGGAPSLPAGAYDGRLCVSVGAAAAQCGAVRVDLGEAGQALVRIEDITYRLEVRGSQLGVSLFHGTMQIDGFFADYRWQGAVLNFDDPEKGTRYELKIGTRRFDAP